MTGEGHGMAVVGAGLVGSLTALLLANRGHHVDVYERRRDPRKVGDAAGRSINLALSERGWRALEKAGAVEAVREIAMPVKARCMHGLDGGLTYQPYGLPGKGRFGHDECIYSVARGPLNRILLEAAEATGRVDVHFEHRLEDFSVSEDAVSLAFEGRSPLHHDRLFGTDGAFSAVRQRMMKGDRFDFSQSYLAHGYKEIAMPPREDGGFAIDPEALHIWPRGHFMLMALPNP
ncbi:MAG: FAD-dependent oxidoreductase, partial [Flavobacteriales bacterium]